MVGACQQNSGIFLVRGGEAGQGLGETPTGVKAGRVAEPPRTGRDAGGGRGWDWARCRRPNHRGRQRARSEMPAGRNRVAAGRDGSGLGARCRGWAGSGTSKNRVGGSQINSKENAL